MEEVAILLGKEEGTMQGASRCCCGTSLTVPQLRVTLLPLYTRVVSSGFPRWLSF